MLFRSQIESAGLWALQSQEVGSRCPPQGTAVMVFKSQSLSDLQQASLWLLLEHDRFELQLAGRLQEHLPQHRYRVLFDATHRLLENGSDRVAFPAPFPASFSGPGLLDGPLSQHWDDDSSGLRLGGVSQQVPGLPVHVQAIYPQQAAIAASWGPYLRVWLLATAVFLLTWGVVSEIGRASCRERV